MRRLLKIFMLTAMIAMLAGPNLALAQPAEEAPAVTPAEQTGTWLSRGPFQVRGSLETGLQSRSNIFLSETNEQSDLIYMVKPGIAVRHELSPTSFWSAEYQGTFAWYRDFTGNNWDSHFIPIAARFGGKTGAFVEVANDFFRSSDPYGSEDLYNLGIVTKRTQNDLWVGPGWVFSEKSWAQVYGQFVYLEYDEDRDKYQIQREYNVGGKWYYKFWPRTSFLVQYTYVKRDYTDQPDNVGENFPRHDMYVGLAWDGTGKLTGEMKFGYSIQDYENDLNAAGQKYDAPDTWIAEVALNWQATPRLAVSFNLARGIKQSTQGFDSGLDEYENNYFTDTMAILGGRFMITQRLSAYANFGYGLQEYNSLISGIEAREDKVAQLEGGLQYDFLKYLYVKGYYLYNYRDSNQPNKGYTDNLFYVAVGGRF